MKFKQDNLKIFLVLKMFTIVYSKDKKKVNRIKKHVYRVVMLFYLYIEFLFYNN